MVHCTVNIESIIRTKHLTLIVYNLKIKNLYYIFLCNNKYNRR